MFGSASGTTPGINLLGFLIPLNQDPYTSLALGLTNSSVFANFRGTLNAAGSATANLNVPANQAIPLGLKLHHAYVVYDSSGKFYLSSNAVPLTFN